MVVGCVDHIINLCGYLELRQILTLNGTMCIVKLKIARRAFVYVQGT